MNDGEIVAAVTAVVDRLGADALTGRPALARSVLRDVLPGEPLAVSLLLAAVESGAAARLVRRDSGVDARILIPQLVGEVAAAHGVEVQRARWAVSTWAKALGWDPADLDSAPLPGTGPGGDAGGDADTVSADTVADTASADTVLSPQTGASKSAQTVRVSTAGSASAETVRTAPKPTRRRSVTAPTERLAGAPAVRPVSPAVPPPSDPQGERRPRRRRPVLIALLVVVLLVVGGIAAFRLAQSDSKPAVAVPVVLHTGSGSGTLTHGATTSAAKDGARLARGDAVDAQHGTLELAMGANAVLRLQQGAKVTLTATGASPTFTFVFGTTYAQVASGHTVTVRTPAGAARVHAGRLVTACSSDSCTFQALEEAQTVTPTEGKAVSVAAHQVLTVPEKSGSVASAAFLAPDLLRSDTWITTNLAKDRTEHRTSAAIGGRSLIGSWKLNFTPAPKTAAVRHRTVQITKQCPAAGGCRLVTKSQYSTCPDPAAGFLCDYAGAVAVTDSKADHVTLTWAGFPVDCADTHTTDGTGEAVDTLVLAGSGSTTTVTGSRRADYTPRSGSACASLSAAVQHPTFTVTGSVGSVTAKDFPTPGGEEQMFNRHISTTSACAAIASPPAKSIGSAACTFPARTDAGGNQRPTGVQYVLYDTGPQVEAAYAQDSAGAGGTSFGDCATGPCEQSVSDPDGRVAIWTSGGTAHLVAIEPSVTHVVIIASGTSMPALFRWYRANRDFHVRPLPYFGL